MSEKSTKDMLQERFAELTAKREAILAQSTPLREQRDKIKNEALALAQTLDDQIMAIEKGMPELDTDLGRLARALGGRSMSTSDAVR